MTPHELRAARKRLGLTQAELGAAIGRRQASISRLEHGAADVPRVVEMALRGLQRELEEERA